ncbi:hypothetical protein H4R24_001126 [Coemansia sp. RSA 988]|nr:hypothetical protein H4R24_001126 [Coemansia sp. RSA 988]
MTLEDTSQRNLDRVGGIIATIAFSICLFTHIWQWARHRCHVLAPLLVFLILRIIGWLLAFIGAVRDDRLLNKRGYIINALAFWLMMLAGLLLIARWDATRRGAKWGVRSWGGTGAALIVCVALGALDAAGQITWLNNPEDDSNTVLKVASIGFLVVAGINAVAVFLLNFREALFYQRPSVRWTFFLTGALLVIRCVFWMLIGLHIVKFEEPKRLIFLYCLTTTLEVATAALWGFMPIAKHLRPKSDGTGTDMQSLKPSTTSEQPLPVEPLPVDNAIPAHEYLNSQASHDSEQGSVHNDSHDNGHDQTPSKTLPQPPTGAQHSYSDAYNNNSTPSMPSSYAPQHPMAASDSNSGQNFNPWAGASLTNSSAASGAPTTGLSSYAQQTLPMVVGPTSYSTQFQQQQQRQPMRVQLQPPAPLQPFSTPLYNTGVNISGGAAGPPMVGQSVNFITPGISQTPFAGAPSQHTTFVKTPYPQPQAIQGQQQSYVDPPKVAYTADYFKENDDDSHSSSHPSDIATAYDAKVPPNNAKEQPLPDNHKNA